MDLGLLLIATVIILFSIVGIFALKNRSLLRIAARNLGRRKANTAIVLSGLLIGTAIITSSYVTGDTLEYIFENNVYRELWTVDEFVHHSRANLSDEARGFSYFPYSYYEKLFEAKERGQLPSVDGLSPAIIEMVPVLNTASQLAEPSVSIVATEPQSFREFGSFRDLDGTLVDEKEILSRRHAAIINKRLADSIEAEEDDLLRIYYTTKRYNASHPETPDIIFNETLLTVAVVVRDEGKANLLSGENIFLNLTFAQHMFGRTGDINIIAVSNKGDVEAGVGLTDSAVSEIESVLGIGEGSSIEVDTVKKDDLEFAQSASEQIAEIFSIMGTFSIIAGVILVINIFVMLAEERKPEMGVSRALGMKRRHLVQTYLFEGSAYALIASFLGTFAGLGIAYLMVLAFGHMFGQAAGIEIPFHFEFISLVLGFCIGVTITFLTVILASWVVSRLNIVRAIRTVPEPSLNRSSRKFVSGAILLVALGILFLLGGISSLSGALFMTGPCMSLLGGAMLLSAYLRPRIPYTVASIAIIFWILAPIEWMEGLQSGLEMFILSGIFLVLSAVLLLMANSDSLISVLIRAIARREKTLPVARVALSYPMKKKFRTGMTLAMFALIIFTVTVIAMIASFQTNSIESAYLEQAGGYDILGVSNTITPIMNISERISSIPSLSGEFVEISSFTYSVVDAYHKERGENSSITVGIYGADSSFFENNDFTFRSMMEGYGSPDEIWEAVRTDSSLVVVDGSAVENMHYETAMMGSLKAKIGDQIVVHTLQGPSAKTIIGILDQAYFFRGMITSDSFADQQFGPKPPTIFFFTASESKMEKIRSLSKDLEREFLSNGLQTIVVKDLIAEVLQIASSIMGLFQVYLGLGLIIGIAGLGIISVRSVVERKQEIGVMRAIGYKKKMIRGAFLMETSFISILGITIGAVLGIALSYYIYQDFFGEAASFVDFLSLIPIWNVLLVTTVAFACTFLATVSSAFKASRMAPAEALRFKE